MKIYIAKIIETQILIYYYKTLKKYLLLGKTSWDDNIKYSIFVDEKEKTLQIFNGNEFDKDDIKILDNELYIYNKKCRKFDVYKAIILLDKIKKYNILFIGIELINIITQNRCKNSDLSILTSRKNYDIFNKKCIEYFQKPNHLFKKYDLIVEYLD